MVTTPEALVPCCELPRTGRHALDREDQFAVRQHRPSACDAAHPSFLLETAVEAVNLEDAFHWFLDRGSGTVGHDPNLATVRPKIFEPTNVADQWIGPQVLKDVPNAIFVARGVDHSGRMNVGRRRRREHLLGHKDPERHALLIGNQMADSANMEEVNFAFLFRILGPVDIDRQVTLAPSELAERGQVNRLASQGTAPVAQGHVPRSSGHGIEQLAVGSLQIRTFMLVGPPVLTRQKG